MKIAILADIHSNLPALETVVDHVERWQPDHIVVVGDVVNRGPRPRECLQLIQARGWPCVLGNHEEYVISHAQPNASRSGIKFRIHRISYWTYQQLNGDVSALTAMPFQRSIITPDGGEVRFVHASMRGTRDGIFPTTPDDVLRQQILPPPRVIGVGHTHKALIRSIDQTLVVNAGSVGLPFDGDPRAGYAQLTRANGDWHAAIVRLDYDRARADRDFDATGFIDDGGPFAQLIRVELRDARSQLFEWTRDYEAAVVSGALTLDESVRRFLQ